MHPLPVHQAQFLVYVCMYVYHSNLQADTDMFPRDSSVTTAKTRISPSCKFAVVNRHCVKISITVLILSFGKQGIVNYRQD
jgi:hypothetical protein